MSQLPLLLFSDGITSATGLGRVTRELATRIHANMRDTFRIGTAGYGGTASRKFPWQQYQLTRVQDWITPELPQIWNDFAGGERGILFTVWNASWLYWLTKPELLPDSELKKFLQTNPFDIWAYVPIDAEGPDGKLHKDVGSILEGFDRVLAYTEYGSRVIERTCPILAPVQYLPHGTDTSVFFQRDRAEARANFRFTNEKKANITDDTWLIGVAATNTFRKDWPLAFETCKILVDRGHKIAMWAHTDSFQRKWDLLGLADSFGMTGRMLFTNDHRSDEDMAMAYTACDVVLGIGAGEGWGLPLSESLACGTPVIHGDYAGAAGFVPRGFLIEPRAWRYDGYYGLKRPVFYASDWSDRAERVLGKGARLAKCYSWDGCWPAWQKWLQEGANGD